MRRRRESRRGVLFVDKPSGISSAEVLRRLRRRFGIRRIGHAGTLDPLAEGVLVVLVGEDTKLAQMFLGSKKGYVARAILGAISNTQDSEGSIVRVHEDWSVSEEQLVEVLHGFVGEYEQIPPAFSAKKVNGKTAYTLAREGMDVRLDPKKVFVHSIALKSFDGVQFEFEVECSAGTYVRTLCHDIGERLGVGAYMASLVRTSSGNIDLSMCKPLDEILDANSLEDVLHPVSPDMLLVPYLKIDSEEYERLLRGMPLRVEPIRVHSFDVELPAIGLAVLDSTGLVASMVHFSLEDGKVLVAPRRMLHLELAF